jgi:predicted alpha/beta-hydrolase family hydrolase
MSGHVIISHGLNSSPDSSKAVAIAQACALLGWTYELPDYQDLDGRMAPMGDVEARIARLQALAEAVQGPLVLAGSSMGAFISAQVSLQVPVMGLFLMAPPIQLQGYDMALRTPDVPVSVVHGWHDELIPADAVCQWAAQQHATLCMVDDSHRLSQHVDFCAQQFALFLGTLA